MRVMVIDDFATMRRILVNLLDQIGHSEVIEVASLSDAKKQIFDFGPDLVISDSSIEGGSGTEFLKWLRQECKSEIAFLLMVTGAEKSYQTEAMELGANATIVKPFTVAALSEKLKKLKMARRVS